MLIWRDYTLGLFDCVDVIIDCSHVEAPFFKTSHCWLHVIPKSTCALCHYALSGTVVGWNGVSFAWPPFTFSVKSFNFAIACHSSGRKHHCLGSQRQRPSSAATLRKARYLLWISRLPKCGWPSLCQRTRLRSCGFTWRNFVVWQHISVDGGTLVAGIWQNTIHCWAKKTCLSARLHLDLSWKRYSRYAVPQYRCVRPTVFAAISCLTCRAL